jgi:putative nucleotidyltransferase with HDIG domain
VKAIKKIPESDSLEIAEAWIRDTSNLVSPPDVCIKIFELMEDDAASAPALGEIISRDTSLTARLLRIVNSPFYGFNRRIDTVSRAVTVIGTSELYNLVVAVTAVTSFSRIPNFIVNIDTFWRHGICVGIIARALAKRCKILHPERLFVAGMLHDVGSLLFFQHAPELTRELLVSSQGNESQLARGEMQALGFNHAQLGAMLLDTWQLPQELTDAIRWHHEPASARSSRLETAVLHIADAVANHCESGAFYTTPSAQLLIHAEAWNILGLEADDALLTEIIEETRAQYRDAVNLFSS